MQLCNILGILFATIKQQRIHKQSGLLFGVDFSDLIASPKTHFQKFQQFVIYSGLLSQFREHTYMLNTDKKRKMTAVEHILINSLKQSKEIQRAVSHLISQMKSMEDLHQKCREIVSSQQKDESPSSLDPSVISDADKIFVFESLRAIANEKSLESYSCFQATSLLHLA